MAVCVRSVIAGRVEAGKDLGLTFFSLKKNNNKIYVVTSKSVQVLNEQTRRGGFVKYCSVKLFKETVAQGTQAIESVVPIET